MDTIVFIAAKIIAEVELIAAEYKLDNVDERLEYIRCLASSLSDPQSDPRRLEAHRFMHNFGLPNSATDIERVMVQALQHLDKVLNSCKTHDEQIRADTEARKFLHSAGV